MPDDYKNIIKLAKMLENKQLLDTEDLKGFVTDIVNAFAQFRSASQEVNKESKDTLNLALKQLNAEHDRILEELNTTKLDVKSDVSEAIVGALGECKKMCDYVLSVKPKDGDPGKDADNEYIIRELAKMIPEMPEMLDIAALNEEIDGKIAKVYAHIKKSTNGFPGVRALQNLIDVSVSSPSNGQVLGYNSTTGRWENASGGSGSGDVVGPASATDTAVALFDGTTGKLIKNSTVTINTVGQASGLNRLTATTNFSLQTGTTTSANGYNIALTAGSVASGNGDGGNVILTPGLKSGTGTNGYIKMFGSSGLFSANFTAGSLTADRIITLPDAAGTLTFGTGTTNQLTYWVDANTVGALTTATYPSLTELSYVKGVTSSIQTQLNAKGAGTVTSVSFTGGLISVATATTTPAFTVAGTSGGVPYFSSASTWATSAALAANAIVIGGGAGAAPATTTTGTGVLTALAVNVGTAGAFVVNGGALGTPSSGTVTNLTGTASININGTVGATTPTTGSFTTVTASTSTTSPTIIGGTGTTSTLTLQPTSGVGTTGSDILFKVGNNGATEAMRVASSGNVAIGMTSTSNGRFSVQAGTSATGTSAFFYNVDGTYNPYLTIQHSSSGIKLVNSSSFGGSANNLMFGNGGVSETMRIDPSGNVLIGTTSQVYSEKLAVQNDQNASTYQLIRNNNSGASAASALALNAFGNSWGIEIGSTAKNSNALTFNVDYLGTPVERMRLTTDGNLGLGITPNAWHSNFRVLQTGLGYASFVGDISNGYAELVNNCYASAASTYNYVASLAATRYSQQLGVHKWYAASAGTSGAAITFTDLMTLNLSGLSLGTSLALTTGTIELGNASDTTISRSAAGIIAVEGSAIAPGSTNFGYLNVPQNSQSADYTAVIGDAGKSIDHPASDANARTFTIPANGSVAYQIGTTLSFSNMSANNVTIAITTDTMYLAGAGTTGSRTLAQYGTATARKVTSTTWIISGINLT